MKKTLIAGIVFLLFLSASLQGISYVRDGKIESAAGNGDVDPTIDLSIDVIIKRVRTLDVEIGQSPTFSVVVKVGEDEWEIGDFKGFDVMNPGTAHFNIPDDAEKEIITIEVFKNGIHADIGNSSRDLEITYSNLNGTWWGNDCIGDDSGYGHAGGHEDGTVNESDCEIWFDIVQEDYDGDGLAYWEETNVYGTDPLKNDLGRDDDGDGIPIEWEDRWGYNPFSYDDHATLDDDNDGIQNYEEYIMSDWFADPFRQDIYIENDYMAEHDGIKPVMPEESIQMQYSAFTKHNIMLLIDDGLMGGSEEIPYEDVNWDSIDQIYKDYFLHNDNNNLRKGIFHYAIIMHEFRDFGRGVGGFNFKRDAFAICSAYVQKWRPREEGMIIGHGGT